MLKLLVILTTLIALSEEYSMGAPDSACTRMEPGHGFGPQTSAAPVALEVDKEEVAPGGQVKVVLKGLEGKKFKGKV